MEENGMFRFFAYQDARSCCWVLSPETIGRICLKKGTFEASWSSICQLKSVAMLGVPCEITLQRVLIGNHVSNPRQGELGVSQAKTWRAQPLNRKQESPCLVCWHLHIPVLSVVVTHSAQVCGSHLITGGGFLCS